MKRLISGIVLVVILSASALAQSPKRFKFDAYDAAMVGAMAGDEFSLRCQHCHETNPIPTGARLGIKAGVFGLTKLLEYKYPDRPKTFRVFKLVIAGLYVGVVAHNLRLK